MSPRASRFVFPAVLALLALFAPACSHGGGPSPGSAAWATLIPMPPVGRITIDQLQQQVGFKLVLPSYLPQGMRIYSASGDQTSGIFPWGSEENSWDASIIVSPLPAGKDSMDFQIHEGLRHAGDVRVDLPHLESTTIGQTTVTCRLEPQELLMTPPPTTLLLENALSPYYFCSWATDKLHLNIQFIWSLSAPIPGIITSDMKDEAMKVVTSMIEDPYVP